MIEKVKLIGLLVAISSLSAGVVDAAEIKKPSVKAVESEVDFDVNAAMRDEAWSIYRLSPPRAAEAAKDFIDTSSEAGADDAMSSVDVQSIADDVLARHYAIDPATGELTPLPMPAAEAPEGEEQDAHNDNDPKPGGDDLVYSVTTKNCTRRCRGGLCFSAEPRLIEQVSEEMLAALKSDPFLNVE